MTTLDTEIRKLQPIELCTLAQILNQSDSWKKLMAIVPKDDNGNHYMFNNDHFLMIDQAIRQQQRSGAEIFLSEWSTLSKKRPTCRFMLDLLVKAQLFRAADYLAVDILKGNPPDRPKFGPAAPIDVSDKVLDELLKQQVEDVQSKSNISAEPSMSWSLQFAEKPIEVVADHIEKLAETACQSDLIKFSSDKSDLIKFNTNDKQVLENLPEQMSDMMKFSAETPVDKIQEDNYVLQEARSEDIPLFVKENMFQSSKVDSAVTEISQSSTSVDSTEISQTSIPNPQIQLPNVSQNIIPVVVMEYNEKDKSM